MKTSLIKFIDFKLKIKLSRFLLGLRKTLPSLSAMKVFIRIFGQIKMAVNYSKIDVEKESRPIP
jgi:hypothetical protein